ncbi:MULTISPECIES: response regulator [Nitrosomonas]|uniref:response regulator n=1 Tax=Nitrosomonas TaxID=914 RepID=UPI00079740CD|nr:MULTISPECIES: response regulator transcription factor [Nitrosomonas]MDL1865813.1 response regulator transcription factor [Betaproteobacteria bacterium PRO4]KXK49986.1 MAG: LuxR family two component transcriptional regulator [Nitrosomonas europaea]MBC6962007.1 DNA-binding response regulator [Nitrosomonas sp.]MBV6388812.1 Response regulator UvrY [Nitrosomonas europaea]MEB2332246.1 response regulator transcription factor [Nitrosomonas sp.]
MIKVMITDDHAIVRQGLKQILSETGDISVTGEAENGIQAIRIIRQQAFDVMLLDISLPDRNGIEVLKQARKECPDLAVLMLSMHNENEFAIRALKAGAAGYLNKQSAPAQLVVAIRQVASGQKYITPALAMELANAIATDTDQPLHTSLSDREYQTLCLIAAGKGLTEISEEMCLSPKTVSVYRARLLEKLKLTNNSELIRYAIMHHLVD